MRLPKSTALLPLLCLAALPATAMTLNSTDIHEGKLMDKRFSFNGFGCSGENRSPQLGWQNLPADTKSLAITAHDPDAPTGSGWWHWLVVNLPASQGSVATGASGTLKQGLELRSDFGSQGYGGPCPPAGHGMHRYQFTVWALPEATQAVKADTPPAMVGYMLNAMALGKATLTATFVTPQEPAR
ncbi:YbhB/YbcL family Raf kinase inhibitor-like protein [Aeromonas bivalvium]|uniref:YbhB/YbcL family Raf kinase inhibitor-like protein n=1 Tax=Aeromonas bivalvium TaxID=440079 RepID=UPI0038D031B6